MFNTVADIARELAPHIEKVEAITNPETLTQKIAVALEPYGEYGQWRYAPAEERAKAQRAVERDHDKEAGEAAYVLQQYAEAASRWLEVEEAETMAPPSPTSAWQRERGKHTDTLPPSEVMLLEILSEQHVARFDRQLGDAFPSAILAAYATALVQPLKSSNASLIRWTEERYGNGWTGRDLVGSLDEVMAVQKLKAAIVAAREARLPADVKASRTTVERGRALVEAAKARGVRMQIPYAFSLTMPKCRVS